MLVPSETILTVVPSFKPVRSRVVPEGTASADRMMVEHDVLDLLASEAPEEPEKVQVVALFSRSARLGPAVGAGDGAGMASTVLMAARLRSKDS
jgi:hypothetical protein